MKIIDRLTARFTNRGRALIMYRNGMAKANIHNHDGAIKDYTVVIDTASSPIQIKAMALYNRALVYSAIKQDQMAIRDLNKLLEMPESLADIKTEATRLLVRMQRRKDKDAS